MIMDLNTKGIFISMFQLATKGELTNLQQKDVLEALNSYGTHLMMNHSYEYAIEVFKKIRLGSRILLEQTENCIDSALENLEVIKKYTDKMEIDLKNLPEYAKLEDDVKTIAFIKSLDKDLYNFSHAERLSGVTRQTLKKHAKKQLHGLKIIEHGGSSYLDKERLIKYYRARFNDDGLPF